MLKGQGEVHEVVRGIRSDLGYNSKATNDTLNEIRESLRCLQAKLKEEVSKNDAPGTWDTMFGYNQTQHYLDGLGEFIGSGGYEAALRIHERRQSAPLRSVYPSESRSLEGNPNVPIFIILHIVALFIISQLRYRIGRMQ